MECFRMVRHGLVAALACAYVVVSAWIVAKQGQLYRESLRRERVLVREFETPAPGTELKKTSPANSIPDIASGPHAAAQVASGSKAIEFAATPVAPPATERVPDRNQPPPTVADRAKPQPSTVPIGDPATDRSSGRIAASTDPLAGDPFWNQPQLTKNWELANLTVGDERKLGADLHDLIVQLNPVAAGGSWLKRVEDVAKPLIEKCRRKDITYNFTILDSDTVNAFSHPGGYVYLTRGLFDLIGEDEDYALQFAVGHEIAHVDLIHAIKCLQDPDVKKMNGGTLRKLYWLIIPFGYLVSEKVNQDFEADEWVYSRMRNLGRSKRESLAFLNKLDGYATRHGFRDGQAKVHLAPDSSLLDIRYRRQTAAWRRLDHLKATFK
jgi:Peptidase family M48